MPARHVLRPRNGFLFYTNPLGALGDGQVSDERASTRDWNPVWDVRTGRFDGGWTVEMRIPFKSLRYRPGKQVWGVSSRRVIRHKNETAFLTRCRTSRQRAGLAASRYAATLVGLEVPAGGQRISRSSRTGSARLTKDRAATPPRPTTSIATPAWTSSTASRSNLTADLTYNTDFAQVEVDDQQVNLTRFNLLFPEKREFFLEGAGHLRLRRGRVDGGYAAVLF